MVNSDIFGHPNYRKQSTAGFCRGCKDGTKGHREGRLLGTFFADRKRCGLLKLYGIREGAGAGKRKL